MENEFIEWCIYDVFISNEEDKKQYCVWDEKSYMKGIPITFDTIEELHKYWVNNIKTVSSVRADAKE